MPGGTPLRGGLQFAGVAGKEQDECAGVSPRAAGALPGVGTLG